MPISANSLIWYYTNNAGSADPTQSLGSSIGTADSITSGVANNIFDDVTGAEASSGTQHFRAIAIKNTDSLNWMNTSIWVTGYIRAASDNDVIYFGVEQPAGSPATIQLIADEYTEPSGITWIAEGTPSSDTIISGTFGTGTIGATDDWGGIWLQRSIPASAAAFSNRSCTIKVEGESSASPLQKLSIEFAVDWKADGAIVVRKIFSDIDAKMA